MNVKPLEISKEKAIRIIENRSPLGLFYFKEKNVFVGIDNSDGDSFVEEFKDKEICLAWLRYEIVEYHTKTDFKKSLEQLKAETEEECNNLNSFEVIITEHLVRAININANSKGEAIKKAQDLYDNEKIVLDYEDFSNVEFK